MRKVYVIIMILVIAATLVRFMIQRPSSDANHSTMQGHAEGSHTGHAEGSHTRTEAAGSSTRSTAGDIAHYTCPMHPSVRAEVPGPCPICGMDLTAVRREDLKSGSIIVNDRQRQLIGLKTGVVQRRHMVRAIRTVGSVTPDETRLHDVSLKYRGWIGDLHANYEGKRVQQGAALFTVYSPDLYTAQQDLIEAADFAERDPERGAAVLDAARTRLELWDLQPDQIEATLRKGEPRKYISIASPATGIVTMKHIVKGSVAKPGQMLMRIADLSTVWIDAVVHESDLSLVSTGLQVRISLDRASTDKTRGRVTWISPTLDLQTRTAKMRIELANPNDWLRPGLFADVSYEIDLGERLAVPSEAILYAGTKRIAFLDMDGGRLKPVEVKIGASADGFVEILDGLAEGDEVVTSANFLIASESKLKSAVQKW